MGWGEKPIKSILSQWTSSLTIKSIDSHNCTATKRLHYLKFPWRYWPDCHLEQQLQLLHHSNKILVVRCLNEERGNKAFMTEKIKMSYYAARIAYVQPDINAKYGTEISSGISVWSFEISSDLYVAQSSIVCRAIIMSESLNLQIKAFASLNRRMKSFNWWIHKVTVTSTHLSLESIFY